MMGMFFGRYSELAERVRQLERPRQVHYQLSERALRGWLLALGDAWDPLRGDGVYLIGLGRALGEEDGPMVERAGCEMLAFFRPHQ